jgi:hypothetical protein
MSGVSLQGVANGADVVRRVSLMEWQSFRSRSDILEFPRFVAQLLYASPSVACRGLLRIDLEYPAQRRSRSSVFIDGCHNKLHLFDHYQNMALGPEAELTNRKGDVARRCVVPGLVPGIHVLLLRTRKDVDGRAKPDQDTVIRRCQLPHLIRLGPLAYDFGRIVW